jgi:UDP-glucuronate 4-epimerase
MFGDGTTSRDYTYVDDIIGGCLAAETRLSSEPEGFCRIWNLGGSHPVTLAEMVEAIGEVLGRTPDLERLPLQAGDVDRTWADLTRSRALAHCDAGAGTNSTRWARWRPMPRSTSA